MKEIRPEHPTEQGDNAEIRAMMFQQRDNHGGIRERVASLEATVKHSATKADVANVKIWGLRYIIGIFLTVVSVGASIFVKLILYP